MLSRTLAIVSGLVILESLIVFFLGGLVIASITGFSMLIAVQIIWRMPCGKAGIMVLAGTLIMIYLSSVREIIGEAGFWIALLWSMTLLFYTYKKAALDGESSCGVVCPIDVEP